jgi:transcriptional regulator with XRE-family HTH domain
MRTVDVARRLRELREQAGLTQEAIAHRAGMTAKYVSQVETGRSNPSVAALASLVEDGLGMPLGAFFATETAVRAEVRQITALLERRPVAVRRRALRIVRALLED